MSQNIEYQYIRPILRPKTTNRNQIFKGQVKEVKCKIHYLNQSQSEVSDYTYWKFDQIGNLIYFGYTINGKGGDRYVYFFDKNNNLTSTEWYNETTSELYTTTRYKYDEFNKLENIQEFNKKGEPRDEKKFFYKNSSKPYEIHVYQDNVIDLSKPIGYYNHELSEIQKLEYDERGNLIKLDNINGNNKLESTIKYIFDKKDRCVDECGYVPEAGYAFLYEFNDTDNSVTFYNSRKGVKEKLHRDKYLGDKLICVSGFRNSKIVIEKEYQYDNMGNLIFMITSEDNKKNSKLERNYTYDKFGNHLSINTLLDDIKTELRTFEFEYY